MTSLLELRPLVRAGVKFPGGSYKSERHFLDFVVDGQSLWELVGKLRDTVSILCQEYSRGETTKAVGRLLLTEEADHPNDRRSFFICAECGDLGCGAITALVERQGNAVTWKTFGYQNNYEETIWIDDYKAVGPFTFDAAVYGQTLMQAVDILHNATR